jgi:hypothetical protein
MRRLSHARPRATKKGKLRDHPAGHRDQSCSMRRMSRPSPQRCNMILTHPPYLWCNGRNIESCPWRWAPTRGCDGKQQSIVIQRLPIKRTYRRLRRVIPSAKCALFHRVRRPHRQPPCLSINHPSIKSFWGIRRRHLRCCRSNRTFGPGKLRMCRHIGRQKMKLLHLRSPGNHLRPFEHTGIV